MVMLENINIKYRICLDGFIESYRAYQCPECDSELTPINIIGFGNYPIGGYRNRMKPNYFWNWVRMSNMFHEKCFSRITN